MRALRIFLIVLLSAAAASPARAAEPQARATVEVTAQFSSRTSLKISAHLLQFDIANPDQAGHATIDFAAGVRTTAGAVVVLSMEAARAIEGPGGAADVETSLTFAGEGAGALSGPVATAEATVAGQWSGSGLRSGRLLFSLRAGAAGSYSVPMRFVLSAP